MVRDERGITVTRFSDKVVQVSVSFSLPYLRPSSIINEEMARSLTVDLYVLLVFVTYHDYALYSKRQCSIYNYFPYFGIDLSKGSYLLVHILCYLFLVKMSLLFLVLYRSL